MLQLVNYLVAGSGFIVWILFVPQILLLYKTKDSKSISLWSLWISWVLQVLIVVQGVLITNWSFVFATSVSIAGVSIEIAMVYYYRIFPGGRKGS